MASSKSKGAKAQPQKMKKSDVELVEAIIGKMRELVDYYPKVRAFYEGKRPLKPYDFLSHRMREEGRDVICLLGDAMDAGIPLWRLPKDLQKQCRNVLLAFVDIIWQSLAGDKEIAQELGDISSRWHERLQDYFDSTTCRDVFWDMVDYGAALCWREMKIWNEHPSWKLEGVEWTIWGNEYSRERLRTMCAAIGKFRKRHPYFCTTLEDALRHLKEPWSELPCAFVKPLGKWKRSFLYEDCIRGCLTASALCGNTSESRALIEYSDWLGGFVMEVFEFLHDYFVRRAAKSPKDARALWIEADADLVSFIYGGGDKHDLDADRIVELANKAAKAEWVARRMANGYDDVKIEFPRPGERQMQSVRLDEGQLAALVSARADGRRDTNRIIGEVRKAAAGSDGGCHHRDTAKDKVVQAVIRHLAKPGVVFSVHDACEKVGGRRNGSWLYSWCHDHEDEIHAQVDILRNAESAFRS